MEIIDTVMTGALPLWLPIIFGVSAAICLFCLLADDDRIGFEIACFVGLAVAVVSGFLIVFGAINTPNHEEYIVRLTDISTTEFIENWEVTKEFEYSDVIQVKKKEKKQ